jgi:hypothetical protein
MRGDTRRTLPAGETIDLPARVKHQWWNAGHSPVHFRVEVRPARNLETILQVASRLAWEGKLSKRGVPTNPFLLALFARTAETYLPGVPLWLGCRHGPGLCRRSSARIRAYLRCAAEHHPHQERASVPHPI